jgi:hypothetical protein
MKWILSPQRRRVDIAERPGVGQGVCASARALFFNLPIDGGMQFFNLFLDSDNASDLVR